MRRRKTATSPWKRTVTMIDRIRRLFYRTSTIAAKRVRGVRESHRAGPQAARLHNGHLLGNPKSNAAANEA